MISFSIHINYSANIYLKNRFFCLHFLIAQCIVSYFKNCKFNLTNNQNYKYIIFKLIFIEFLDEEIKSKCVTTVEDIIS